MKKKILPIFAYQNGIQKLSETIKNPEIDFDSLKISLLNIDRTRIKPYSIKTAIAETKLNRTPSFFETSNTLWPTDKMFETVSFHIVKPCNMKCKFCYATFDDMKLHGQISLMDAMTVVRKLKQAGMQKITFAGGEPMLYRHITAIIRYAKKIGLTTSIISNGTLMTEEWLRKMKPYLDWVGISVDSTNTETNEKIGRTIRKGFDPTNIIYSIKSLGYKLKINTVVNSYNWKEDMNGFINWCQPDRWKIFQALRVEGQNDDQFDEMKVTSQQFHYFLVNHNQIKVAVPEDNEAMTGSYLLVDPQGRLYENSSGGHTYSLPLQNYSVLECLKQINLDRDMFIKRGGIYKW